LYRKEDEEEEEEEEEEEIGFQVSIHNFSRISEYILLFVCFVCAYCVDVIKN